MKQHKLLKNDGMKTVMASIISILIGLVVGSLLILIVGIFNKNLSLASAWEGIRLVFGGLFSTGRTASGALTFGFNPQNIGNMLFRATPLILTGLSVAVAFKTGLFNIGAPGQYLMSIAATLVIALSIPSGSIPGFLIWTLAFVGGILAGAIWGAIPGLVKAFLNINEVLACIMTNWIAANVVTWIFDGSRFCNTVENTKTGYIYKTSYGLTQVDGVWTYVDGNGIATAKMGLDKLFPGSQVNGGIIIAAVIAILVYILMNKTTLGYELKACGSNRHAARYAGINDKRNIVLSMAIAGALSGAAAGFNGISVALLAANNPIAVIFTGCFMSTLDIVGLQLTKLTAYNEYITDVIISVIVYLSAFSLVIKMLFDRKRKRKKAAMIAAAAVAPATPDENEPVSKEIEEGGEEA